jgi:iron complex outermembrane recepter protein
MKYRGIARAGAACGVWGTLALLAMAGPVAAQQGTPAATPTTALERVEIVGTTPIGGGQPRERIPSNVQVVNTRQLRELGPLNLPELMSRHLGSVSVNETQGNPYQVEVNFRGFNASPLLGTPQGLSVFVDGVRVNEPFGDIVNWDLIPRNAISSVALMPGSNPLFGLNTLGGALAVNLKRGDTDEGTEAELGAGSWGRRSVEASHGMRLGDSGHLFLAGTAFREDGWRDFSPSRLRQVFLRGGQSTAAWQWDVSLTHADNELIGNGPLPEGLLAANRRQVYTRPDITDNQLDGLTLHGSFTLSPQDKLTGLLYARRLRANTLNGDLNDDFDPPAVTESGVENRTQARQRSQGLALQWTRSADAYAVTLGASHDRAKTDFQQTAAEGELDATRAVVNVEPAEINALIHGTTRTNSVYASGTVEAAGGLHVTLSGRYNRTRVVTIDDGRAQLGLLTNLDAEGTYSRFNPALGATWKLSPAVTLYGGASQGNRAPNPIELGCSDPDQPCVLPNALQSDPPLQQVIARTVEAGVRGAADGWRWNAGVFRTVNRDDILFVSNQRAAGYFQNFGRTRRQGVELGVSGRAGAFDAAATYGYVDATYRSSACVVSQANSTAETSGACTGDDEIEVRPGDRIPGIARHNLKLDLGWRPWPALRVGVNVSGHSSQYVRGNENNRHATDGAEFSGSGQVGGFALVNLNAAWEFAPGWSVNAKLGNVFDRRYNTGGLLGENAFDAAGALQAPADWRNDQFVAPGAPRSFWLALQYRPG